MQSTIAPEPLELIGNRYKRSGKTWVADELRRRPDYSIDPVPYPERPWEVRLTRVDDRVHAYWINVFDLIAGRANFRLVEETA